MQRQGKTISMLFFKRIGLLASLLLVSFTTSADYSPVYTCPGPNACIIKTFNGLEFPDGSIQTTAASGSGGTPGGSNTDVQVNSSGSFFGNSLFTYDKVGTVTMPNLILGTDYNILDTSAKLSLDPNVRRTFDSAERISLDYENRTLQDSSNQPSINWEGRHTLDSGGNESSDWSNRTLKNDSNVGTLLWQANQLVDASGIVSTYWSNRLLIDASGGAESIDWDNRILVDAANNNSLTWNSRTMVDQYGVTNLDWNNYLLMNQSANPVMNWNESALLQPNGIDFSIAWQQYLALDNTATNSINWDQRQLFDNAGNTVIDYQDGKIYHPDIGVGRVAVVDAANAALYNPNNGNQVMDIGNQQLYDANGQADVNLRDRELVDSSSNVQISWEGGVEIWGSVLGLDQNQSIDTNNRYLHDANGDNCIDYSNNNGGIVLFHDMNFQGNHINAYNGDTTAGNGVSSVVATAVLTGQSSSIGSTTLFTPSTPGLYTVKAYFNPANIGSAGTLAVNIIWTDTNQSRTKYAGSAAGATLSLSASGYDQGSTVIFAQGGLSHINYSTTVTGAVGSPTYDLYLEVDRGT